MWVRSFVRSFVRRIFVFYHFVTFHKPDPSHRCTQQHPQVDLSRQLRVCLQQNYFPATKTEIVTLDKKTVESHPENRLPRLNSVHLCSERHRHLISPASKPVGTCSREQSKEATISMTANNLQACLCILATVSASIPATAGALMPLSRHVVPHPPPLDPTFCSPHSPLTQTATTPAATTLPLQMNGKSTRTSIYGKLTRITNNVCYHRIAKAARWIRI
eukprot:jgi/Psemu1/307382/fgenesh1_kg.325_\